MKALRYHECPECRRISPYLQTVCGCGYKFTGSLSERQFKTCNSCGSLVPASQLFCDCGKFLPLQKEVLTESDIEAAYQNGRFAGIAEERARNEREWRQFFIDAGLKNTITDEPIRNRTDFAKWKAAYEKLRKQRESENAAKPKSRSVYYDYCTKDDMAFEVTVKYARILEDISPDAKHDTYGIIFYRAVGALCTFAELVLGADRNRSLFIVGGWCRQCADDGSIRAEMLSSADAVGSAMDGKSGAEVIRSASFAIQKEINSQPDIDLSARVGTCLVDFSKEYVVQIKHGI